jgi:hypothetical protein
MAPQTSDVHVNPSDETIRLGPLAGLTPAL